MNSRRKVPLFAVARRETCSTARNESGRTASLRLAAPIARATLPDCGPNADVSSNSITFGKPREVKSGFTLVTEVEWLPIRTPTTYRNLTATVSIRIRGRESRLPLPLSTDARAVIAKSELQQATHCLRKAIMRIRQHKHHSMASDRMGRSQSEVSDRQQRKSGSAGLLHSCLEMPIQARVLENELEVFRGRVFSIFHFRHHYFRCIGQRAANGIQHHSEKIQSFRKRLRLRFAAQPAHLPLSLRPVAPG